MLLGSGISRAAEIPTGWEIILDLARRVAVAEGAEERADGAAWYRTRFNAEPDYSALLDMLSLTPAQRRAILHNYIEATAEDLEAGRRVPTLAHKAIARLVRDGFIKVIVTTNFDRLLESALREVGVEPTVIRSVDDLAGANPIVHSRCYILKLHGDYPDNRILNTDDELARYPAEFDRQLDRILDEYGLIVAGWSGEWDPALRAAIQRAPSRRYPTYWASRGAPSAPAQDLITHRAARVAQITDADGFFETLQQMVEMLHRTRRRHPDTIEFMLAAVKRYLARPEHRIELNDLVSGELRRINDRIRSSEFPVQMGSVNWEILNQRWDALEALTEPLARATGLMGRWGDGGEFDLVEGSVRTLLDQPAESGNNALLALRTYPAYLCFLTYALGLTKARRFDTLLRWFHTDVSRTRHEVREASRYLFMSYWDDAEPDWWKQRRPEYANHKTPWADYLVDHVVPWSADYGLTPGQALENYNMTEMLGGFAALGKYEAEALQTLDEFTWMPYGRLMWSGSDRAATLALLEGEELHRQLLAAGFSNGAPAHWEGVKNNIMLLARRVGW